MRPWWAAVLLFFCAGLVSPGGLAQVVTGQAAGGLEQAEAQPGGGLRLRTINAYAEDQTLFVDAALELRLGDAAREALSNGIALSFELEVRVYEGRDLFWDQRVMTVSEEIQLRFNEFSKQYLVSRSRSGKFGRYFRLENALMAIGDVRRLALGPVDGLRKGVRHEGRLRLHLLTERLPSPLQLPALFDEQWRIDSGWSSWVLKLPEAGPGPAPKSGDAAAKQPSTRSGGRSR